MAASTTIRLPLTSARRAVLNRRSLLLAYATASYNLLEGVVAVAAGAAATSAALLGFGLDSFIEVSSALVVIWQFRSRLPEARERLALKLIAASFFALAAWISFDSVRHLLGAEQAEVSRVGIGVATVSVVVMPLLVWAKRRTGRELGSATVVADSVQTLLCTYLSAVLLVGLLLNWAFGWSWADPVAALVIAGVAVKEGLEAWRGEQCDDCAAPAMAAEGSPPHRPGRTHIMTSNAKPKASETPTDRQRRVWDKGAPSYDRQIAFFERIQFGGGRQWLGARARGRVLEVAIGTGLNLPHYPPDVTVTGVDLSPAMLAIARRRAADLGRAVDLHESDAESLPFADASFDTVVCALSLCSIPAPATAIGEMKRVLVPGGRLLLLDHIGSSWPPIYAAQWLLERVTIRTGGEHFTRRQLPLVRAAGFDIVEVERLKAGSIERVHARRPLDA